MDVNREELAPDDDNAQDNDERSIIDELHVNNDEAAQDIQDTE
jgi:hypothetical protein